MKDMENRPLLLGEYILDTGATVRATAKVFKISKSTVHKDVTERLRNVSPSLYAEVGKVLLQNKNDRHRRGGEATRQKYLHIREMKEKQKTP